MCDIIWWCIVGAYLLCVTWSGYHIPGSPYKLTVLSGSDASKVVCSGEGLKHATVGQEAEIHINTESAGPGNLIINNIKVNASLNV